MPDASVTSATDKTEEVKLNASLPTDLHREVKSRAALKGITIPALIEIALREHLAANKAA